MDIILDTYHTLSLIQASGDVWDACLQYLTKNQQSALLTALSLSHDT